MIHGKFSLEDYKKIYKSKNYCIIDSNLYLKKDNCIVHGIRDKNQVDSYFDKMPNCKKQNFNKFYIYYDSNKYKVNVIEKVSEFVDKIVQNNKIDSNISGYYRGHSNYEYTLIPSIYREDYLINNEYNIYRDIISQKPHLFEDCNTTLEKLVKMQHFGIPTRLLDLTENPLIALFFACISNNSYYGEVITFNVNKKRFVKYYDSDTVDVLSNIAKLDEKFNIPDSEFDCCQSESFPSFNALTEIKKLCHFICEDKPYFENRINPSHLDNYALIVKPKLANERIVNQSGAFILFGINREKSCCANTDSIIEKFTQQIYIIAPDRKKEILQQLELFNINYSTVYCDLENTAKYFKSKYKK
ncbi:FRG domain-containing protein [Clostridium tyrobutyricum]|uniref:FRG domain-containing protein n=1 Tax=Clostridium tyrobutyricum TaxID=1519 RepID=UPI001C389C48|nr:FRG domain-containing protein [Clostridium tyrobutyricum]MBV4449258.1 FRG domain-containing protein [Clostridium tyrobutyricum]